MFTYSFRTEHQSVCQCLTRVIRKCLYLPQAHWHVLCEVRISSAVMDRNAAVCDVIIKLIWLCWLIFAVCFYAGYSATGNHSSKSSWINIANMHTVQHKRARPLLRIIACNHEYTENHLFS